MVLFDEFHERNLLSDVALALVKQLQQTRRPDLKMVVMSATLDAEPVADYLKHLQPRQRDLRPAFPGEGAKRVRDEDLHPAMPLAPF